MSAQRSVPSAAASGSALRVVAALLLGIAAGAAIALLVTARATDATRRRTTITAPSPDRSRVAFVQEVPCPTGICEELRLGDSEATSTTIASVGSSSCDEIVWTPDGKRVAFVVGGSEMSLFDSQTGKLAGTVRLLTNEAAQTRLARGITFSENGRAATFDDCPRAHSGCRAGVVGVPQ